MKEPRFGAMLSKPDYEPQRAARRDPNPAVPFCDSGFPIMSRTEKIVFFILAGLLATFLTINPLGWPW